MARAVITWMPVSRPTVMVITMLVGAQPSAW
jgi:hypothetical protein